MARHNGKFIRGDTSPRSALDHALHQRDSNTLEMVRRAIEHRQVMLAFQPVVQSGQFDRVAFYEGLIRVLDETGRVIPAAQFMNTVEETEYGRMLDCLALQRGLEELSREPQLRLAVNMSARSVGYKKWTQALNRGLSRDPTIAERLILEITEASVNTIPELVLSFMGDLHQKGISFAVDDFGAGFTALRYFKDFTFDIMKLDGQFTRNINSDPDNQVMVGALRAIAEQFDMFTVAERVETPDEAECLRQLGIDCQQGYLFGAPTVRPAWRDHAQQRPA